LDALNCALLDLHSLKSLSLVIDFCNKIADKNFSKLGLSAQILTSLQILDLKFSGVTDQGLKEFSNLFRPKINSLQSFSLDLSGCQNITSEGLQSLCQGLQRLESLQSMSLNFKFCNLITDEGLKTLAETLQKLTSLRSISLSFGQLSPTADGITEEYRNEILNELNEFLDDFQDGMTNVILNQMVANNPAEITDAGFKNLAESLKELTSLQFIYLNFRECTKIKEGLNNIAESLQRLDFLQSISLDFGQCSEITGESLKNLGEALQKLTLLQFISINLMECEKIGREDLSNFSLGFRKLRCLKKLVCSPDDLNYY